MAVLRKAFALGVVLSSTTALSKDDVPVFKAGEWEIAMSQEGGATYKDGKQESGTSSIDADRPKQVGTRCFKKKEARLTPEQFVPGCTATNVTYTRNEMKADISCPNRAMEMTGSIRMTITDEGTKMNGFQIVSGGGQAVGAVMMANIEMKRLGKCKKPKK